LPSQGGQHELVPHRRARLATYSLRASFLLAGGRLGPRFERQLRLVPPTLLPALAASAILSDTTAGLDFRLAAAALAALIAWLTRSAGATLLAGMLALWLLQLSFGAR
jgi:branched-subunit amino acid transport protein